MIITVGLLAYCTWTLLCVIRLLLDMIFAWFEYKDCDDLFKWSHQYNYWDTLSMVRGTWESPYDRFMRGKK